jgi:hypothetical protein
MMLTLPAGGDGAASSQRPSVSPLRGPGGTVGARWRASVQRVIGINKSTPQLAKVSTGLQHVTNAK